MPEKRMAAIAISFALGILAAEYASLLVCSLATALALTSFMVLNQTKQRNALILVATLFLLGAGRHHAVKQISASDISKNMGLVTAIEGVVISEPEARKDNVRTILHISRAEVQGKWQPLTGKVMAYFYNSPGSHIPKVDYGDRVLLSEGLYAPMEPSNPGKFSWKKYLARKGIYACISVREPERIKVLKRNTGNSVVSAALAAKNYLSRCIEKLHPKEEASVVIGMVLGTYSYLPGHTFRDFSRTGTLHLLAASGFNCAILLIVSGFILSKVGLCPKTRVPIVLALILAYLLLVGLKPSLVRASLMAGLWLLAIPLARPSNTKNIFFAAAFIVLLINPSDLFDVGFQLSYLSVWALIEVLPVIEIAAQRLNQTTPHVVSPTKKRKYPLVNLKRIMSSAAVATVAISLVTTPITAHYFNYISLVSIPANMVLALGVPFVFIAGFASAVAVHVAPLGVLVGFIGTWVTKGMLWVVHQLGSMQFCSISVTSPNLPMIAGYYILLYALLSYMRSKLELK